VKYFGRYYAEKQRKWETQQTKIRTSLREEEMGSTLNGNTLLHYSTE